MSIDNIAQHIADATWGFLPSRQVKPVHLANGLFRELTQQSKTPALLRKAAGGFRSGRSRETTKQCREQIRSRVIEPEAGDIPLGRVEQLRAALDLVFHQDRALFATGSYYSPTLTHRGHTTKDPSHSGTGVFLAHVLLDGSPKTVSVLRNILDIESDNVSLLASPLVDDAPMAPPPECSEDVRRRVAESPLLGGVQSSFETVSSYAEYLEKTVLLQRIVTLGSFALLLHLASPYEWKHPSKPPLFLASNDPSRAARDASRATYRVASRGMLHAFEAGLKDEYSSSGQDDLSGEEYLELVKTTLFNREEPSEERSLDQFRLNYRTERAGESPAFQSFVQALAPIAFEYVGSSAPTSCYAFLGRLAGVVFPRLGGAGDKYYRPAPQFLDMLVASLVQPRTEVPASTFWSLAWERYGIICGARKERDAEVLQSWGIPTLSATHLSRNALKLNAELQRMGYLQRFADGVGLISSGVK